MLVSLETHGNYKFANINGCLLIYGRVGRTARLGEKGDALLFLQPVEMDYLQDLQKHGASLEEFPLLKLLDSFPLYGQKHHNKNLLSLEMHPWVLTLHKAIESFILMGVCYCFFIEIFFL